MRFLKQQEKNIYIVKWAELLNAKLTKYDLPLLGNDKDKIKKYYGPWYEQVLMQLASKAMSVMSIVKEVYGISGEKIQPPKEWLKKELPWLSWTNVIIDDQPFLHYDLCPLCHPQVGEKIIARSGRDGIKIHTMTCKALQTVNYDKLIKEYWYTEGESKK